ncbi:MAG: hypothetical protein WBN28_14725 [Lutimonas sp.]
MKTKNIKNILFTFFVMMFLTSYNTYSQDFDLGNYKTIYNFSTTKNADQSRLLEVSFVARNKKDRKDNIPVYEAEIQFFNVAEEDVLLGTAKTDKDGIARLLLKDDQVYTKNEEGLIVIKAVFEGSDTMDAEEEELYIRDLFLDLNLEEVDSVKTITVNAYTLDSLGNQEAVSEVDFGIFIGGMLSKMKIDEGTIEDGEYVFEMEEMVPGDMDGDVEIFAIVEDNDDFGSVVQKESAAWGTHREGIEPENNKLWSEAAPIWMYVVLSVLLGGVWINFVYTVVNLFKIKKEGQRFEMKS